MIGFYSTNKRYNIKTCCLVVVPHKTSTLPSTTPTEPTSKTTKTHHLPLQTTTEQYQIETTTAKSEEFTTDQRQTTEHEIIETTVESINTR